MAVFSEDLVFAHHFEATCLPPTLSPCKSAIVVAIDYTPVKNYLKWWAIQLAIHSIVNA